MKKIRAAAPRKKRMNLQAANDSLYAAAECSLDAIFICEAVRNPLGEIDDFVFTYLNRNAVTVAAVPEAQLLGGRMGALLPMVHTLGLFERYKHVVQTGEPLIHEYSLQNAQGETLWRRVQAVKLRDGFVVTASDITARKSSELRLAELTERFTLATRAGGLGVWDLDLVHQQITWDDATFRLYGADRDGPGGTASVGAQACIRRTGRGPSRRSNRP